MKNSNSSSISRRQFLKLSGLAAAAWFTARCAPALEAPDTTISSTEMGAASSTAPQPTLVPPATATPTVTPIPIVPQLPAIVQRYPQVPSRVIRAIHPGVWQDGELVPNALRQMLDAAITQLTQLDDALAAWQALFQPEERIAIKVNTLAYGSYWTHLPLVLAVTERLQAAGIPAEQIVIYDRATSDLSQAGYPVNRDGPGARCYGTDGNYASGWKLLEQDIRLSNILIESHALINIPILKTHSMDGAGMSFALKNHYGTFDQPSNFHQARMTKALGELNALPPIRDRARLIIGDALKIVKDNWVSAFDGDSIFMSFDSVAHDTLGLQTLTDVQTANGLASEATRKPALAWLEYAASLGLGANTMENIQFVEQRLD